MSNESPFATPPIEQATVVKSNTMTIVAGVLGILLFVALACGGVLVALLIPAVGAARTAARTAIASNNMKQIGLAFHNYHSAYGELPRPVVFDSSGQPLHSWRVTLLPFLEDSRYGQWDDQQAWNSEVNAALHRPVPRIFLSPFDNDRDTVQTHVMTIRHPDAMMPGDQTIEFSDVADGLAATVLAVHVPAPTVNWAEPRDITLADAQTALANASQTEPCLLLLGDGSVRVIHSPLAPQQLQAMTTRNGNEPVTN